MKRSKLCITFLICVSTALAEEIPKKRRNKELCLEGRTPSSFPARSSKIIASPVVQGSLSPITISDSKLQGQIKVEGASQLNLVDAIGKVDINSVSLNGVDISSSNFMGAPGIKLVYTPCAGGANSLQLTGMSIDGDVDMQSCGAFEYFDIIGHVRLSGKVQGGYADIEGRDYSGGQPTVVNGNLGNGIRLMGGTLLCNSNISGNIFVVDSFIGDGGAYHGKLFETTSGIVIDSQMRYASFTGTNNFSGLFYLDYADLEDVTISGEPNCDFREICHGTTVNEGGTVGKGAMLNGRVTIHGDLGEETIVDGTVAPGETPTIGVQLEHDATFTGPGSEMKGTIRIDGVSNITNSNLYGTGVSSFPLNITNSTISNASYVSPGQIIGSNISGTTIYVPTWVYTIYNASLTGGTFGVSIVICGNWPANYVFSNSDNGANCLSSLSGDLL